MRYALKFDRPEPTVVESGEDIEYLRDLLIRSDEIAIDTETTGLDIAKDVVVYWSVAVNLKERFFLTVDQLPLFADILANPWKTWIGSQMKYDANMLANSGAPVAGDLYCTLTMDRLLDPGEEHGLKEAYERQFQERMKSFPETFYPKNRSGKHQKPKGKEMYEILVERFEEDPELVTDYATMDAWATLRLYQRLRTQLTQKITWAGYTLWDIFLWLEVPMTRTLYNMERRGVPLDKKYLTDRVPDIDRRTAEIEAMINKSAGRLMNLASPKMLGAWLYDELGYDHLETTKTGQKKLDKQAYAYLIDQGCEEAALIQEHKTLSKTKSTYIIGLIDRCDVRGILHTTLNQHVADTGRLSSSDPNLQNQMRKGTGALNIRMAFIAGIGYVLIVGDYDQLEMYILGHYSGDANLLHAIAIGRDIHSANVEIVFEEPYDEMVAAKKADKKDERQIYLCEKRNEVKAVGFGICYGKAAGSLGRDLGYHKVVEKDHPEWDDKRIHAYATAMAQDKIDLFFEKSPGIRKFIKKTIRQAYRTGYVETVLGRQRTLKNLLDWDMMLDHKLAAQKKGGKLCWCNACQASRSDERRAVNTRIQGCLPWKTRVLTDKGLLPIGEIEEKGKVWTGRKWSPYARLDRGMCRLASIELRNGQILECDTRHEVLVVGKDGYEFKSFSALEPGDEVCLSLADVKECGRPMVSNLAYWLGFSVGNGSSSKGSGHRNALTMTFGDRVRRYKKEEKEREFIKFLIENGYTPQKSQIAENKISVTVESKRFRNWWEKCGYHWGETAHLKKVPKKIWISSAKDRTEFLLGLLDADGHAKDEGCPNLHMCNETLLREVQILARTVGIESILRGPLPNGGFTSWRLDFNGAHLASLGYGERKRMIVRNTAPFFVIKEFLEELEKRGATLERGSDTTLISRFRKGGSASVYTVRKMKEKYLPHMDTPLYATSEIVEIRTHDKEEKTFTLSVDDPDHRFDSEGVISKNSAADVCASAMVRIESCEELHELGYQQVLQVHDEIVGRCPDETKERATEIVQYHMEHPGLRLNVPLRAGPHWADSWADAKG